MSDTIGPGSYNDSEQYIELVKAPCHIKVRQMKLTENNRKKC